MSAMRRRVVIHFDERGMVELVALAGPFGEAGRVAQAALAGDLAIGPPRDREKMLRKVELGVTAGTYECIRLLAISEHVSWQEAARRVIEHWVARYSTCGPQARRAG